MGVRASHPLRPNPHVQIHPHPPLFTLLQSPLIGYNVHREDSKLQTQTVDLPLIRQEMLVDETARVYFPRRRIFISAEGKFS